MMRSLFSGVSGLSNNQLKMDVIGNNIANINTIGFKTSRISFSEELSQVIEGANETSSGALTNGVLVGLGVKTGGIERDFSQGILQTTGKQTDLGIDGDGFFVLSDGISESYTRAGNLHFDGNGRLVTTGGSNVQGWTAGIDGELSQTAPLGNISFDASVISAAQSSENVAISGNLDATAVPVQEQWTASRTFTTAGAVPALATTDFNALEQTTTPLIDGDEITITGTNSDGSPVNATFTYGAANDGTTVQDLVDIVTASFSGDAALVDGKIVLTDFNYGDSEITITLAEGAGNTGAITLPGFINTAKGFAPKVSSSVEIFDSLGSRHTLNVVFTKTENDREWNFEMSLGETETIIEGNTGTIGFSEEGILETILYDRGESRLVFDPGDGADNVSLNLDFENTAGFSGLTQFAGRSAITLPYQDGQAHGKLSSYTIDETGRIVGTFTNGRSRLIAQLAIAKVNNPEGMIHVGDNVYQLSGSTGVPAIGKAGEHFPTAILSGTLEASNVDLSKEFTEMIIAQRAFQANARVITVSDQFLSEVTQLKR